MVEKTATNTVSNFIISKLQQSDCMYLFVNERPVSVQYVGLMVLGSSPETCMLSTVCVLLRCRSSAGFSLCYWQCRRPIGCSAQVQTLHWSKVEQEGSNHRPLLSLRTGREEEEEKEEGGREHTASNLTATLPQANTSHTEVEGTNAKFDFMKPFTHKVRRAKGKRADCFELTPIVSAKDPLKTPNKHTYKMHS